MADLDPALINAVKGFEGYAARPKWDYRQYTSGFGTRASGPSEVIDRATAESRLQDALRGAAGQVDAAFPGLSPGTRNALTSLTYNAGPGWMKSGLGDAIRAGDMDRAKTIFGQYNHAGGAVSDGLTARRTQEASWFDQAPPRPPMSIPQQAPQMGGAPLPLFAPQQPPPMQQQAPQALQGAPQAPQGPQSAAPQSIFSMLQPGPSSAPSGVPLFAGGPQQMTGNDLATWWARQNPTG
jgi:GH24 family phage-related lysozyme (muramidase)